MVWIQEESYDKQEDALYKRLFEVGEKKDKVGKKAVQEELRALKAKIKVLNKQIRAELDKQADYNRVAKPYMDAERLLKQAENYTHFGELEARYRAIKAETANAQA